MYAFVGGCDVAMGCVTHRCSASWATSPKDELEWGDDDSAPSFSPGSSQRRHASMTSAAGAICRYATSAARRRALTLDRAGPITPAGHRWVSKRREH